MLTYSGKTLVRESRLASSGLALLLLQLVAGSARAEQVPPRDVRDRSEVPSRFDLRFSTGLGRGYVQATTTAYRLGLGADVWLSPNVGVGAEVAYLLQVNAVGGATDASLVMPEVAYRSPISAKSYLLLVGAVGYARSEVTVRGERVECTDDCEDLPEYESDLLYSHDLVSSLQLGVIAYRGPVFFSFALRGDVIGLVSSNSVPVHGAMTLNGSFGF